jgi:hypothetical protein
VPPHFQIELDNDHLRVGFTRCAATNATLVREVAELLHGLQTQRSLGGREPLLIDGPASLPVFAAITHAVAHAYPAIAVKDPKLSAYVVVISHDPGWAVGDLVDDNGRTLDDRQGPDAG